MGVMNPLVWRSPDEIKDAKERFDDWMRIVQASQQAVEGMGVAEQANRELQKKIDEKTKVSVSPKQRGLISAGVGNVGRFIPGEVAAGVEIVDFLTSEVLEPLVADLQRKGLPRVDRGSMQEFLMRKVQVHAAGDNLPIPEEELTVKPREGDENWPVNDPKRGKEGRADSDDGKDSPFGKKKKKRETRELIRF